MSQSSVFFFSSRRRHTRSVSAFLLNRSSDLSLVAVGGKRTSARVNIVPCSGTKKRGTEDRKSGSAGMPRPISYAVFCLKKKKTNQQDRVVDPEHKRDDDAELEPPAAHLPTLP